MSTHKTKSETDKSKQVLSAGISKNHTREGNYCAYNLQNNKKNHIKKWKQLAFDKQVELSFASAIVVFTAVLTFTAIYQLTIISGQIHIENRAWLCSVGVSTDGGFKVGESPTVILKFNNSGKSPARDATLKYNMNLRSQPLPDNMPLGQYLSQEPSRGVVPPGSEFSSPKYTKQQIIFTEDSLRQLSKNEQRLYVFGFIDYLDIFNIRHCTNFCFASRVDSVDNKLGFQACSNNNEMADKECKYN